MGQGQHLLIKSLRLLHIISTADQADDESTDDVSTDGGGGPNEANETTDEKSETIDEKLMKQSGKRRLKLIVL